MPPKQENDAARIRHKQAAASCIPERSNIQGFIRDDGLWEVEARLRDTKPFTQAADRYREELKPGQPVIISACG